MLAEDVSSGIMPVISAYRESNEFKIIVEGEKESIKLALALLASISRDASDKLSWEEVISESIREISYEMVYHGRATFELIWVDQDKLIGRISSFPSVYLAKIHGFYLQLVPKPDRVLYENRRIILLPEKDVWSIDLPKALGGPKGQKKIVRRMQKHGSVCPDFLIDDMRVENNRIHFDNELYWRTRDIEQWRITRRWGWHHRDCNIKDRTEIFLFYRIITFKWALALLREKIINEINKLLKRIEIDVAITLEGLPSSTQVIGIRKRMMNGDIDFLEASRLTDIR